MEMTAYPVLVEVQSEMARMKIIYDLYSAFEKFREDVSLTAWGELDVEVLKEGVDGAEKAIKKLPIKRWQQGHQYGEECAVCLTNFQPGDELRQLPCGHAFRVNCIDQWLLGKQGSTSTLKQSLPACPLCKEPLIKEPTDGEGVTHLGVSGGVQMNSRQTIPNTF